MDASDNAMTAPKFRVMWRASSTGASVILLIPTPHPFQI